MEGDGGTSSHIGGVDQGEGTYIRDGHPELEAHEGDSLMSEGLWAEGALQCLPPDTGVREEYLTEEPSPRTILSREGGGGVHAVANATE